MQQECTCCIKTQFYWVLMQRSYGRTTYYIIWFRPVQQLSCAPLCACVLLCLWVATSCAC
jgi:hypothetical protein